MSAAKVVRGRGLTVAPRQKEPSPEEETLGRLLQGAGKASVVRALARFLYEEELERERISELRKIGS